MKPKSPKLRFLITLHALFKYTDKDHRLNSTKLNKILEPYNLDCTGRVITDSVRVIRDYGLEVETKGSWDNCGIWLKDRPITDSQLNALIFAVTTNPHLSQEQVESTLSALAPLVTIYQEPLLKSYTNNTLDRPLDVDLFDKYCAIIDAIANKRRVRVKQYSLKYDSKVQTIYMTAQCPNFYTPKCIHQANNKLYMIGYNHNDDRVDAIDLQSIAEVKIAFKHKDIKVEETQKIIDSIDPQTYIEEIRGPLVYKGSVTFKCRAPFLEYLYRTFGDPEGPVIKDDRSRCTYTVSEAEIWAKTLFDLSNADYHGIRIVGPDEAITAINAYYNKTIELLVNPNLPKYFK